MFARLFRYRTPLKVGNLCYTDSMQEHRSLWPAWAHFLQRKGLNDFVAALLESAGPLSIFLAQFMHAGQPFLSRTLPESHWQALATLLEDPNESRSFAAFLREEVNR
jgi:hypothetical protein